MQGLMTVLFGVLLLAGCSTPQQRAAAAQLDMARMMALFGPACTQLGYAAGTDAWRNCVLRLDARDDLQRYGYPQGRPHCALSGYAGQYW